MDSGIIGAFIGIAFLTVVNIAAVAVSYGRLTQQVKDIAGRVERLERTYDAGGTCVDVQKVREA